MKIRCVVKFERSFFKQEESNMSLADDLAKYMDNHGHAAITPRAAEVVIVGERHQHLRFGGFGEFRTVAVRRVVSELLIDQRFRYFGNESFMNAGPARQAVRDYWLRHRLPPDFDLHASGVDAMDREKVVAQVMPRRFQPILDDLRASKRYVLAIGTRAGGVSARDHGLARHFFEEIADRRIAPGTPGVLLLGAAHAAAKPFFLRQTTTRMLLEQRGHDCVSILLMTDVVGDPDDPLNEDDAVYPLASGNSSVNKNRFAGGLPNTSSIVLSALTAKPRAFFSTPGHYPPFGLRMTNKPRIFLNTRLPGSPFFRVREPHSDSGYSIADCYEYLVLVTGF